MSRPRSERLSARLVASHLGVMVAVSVVLGVLVAALALPLAGGIGLGSRAASETAKKLPDQLATDPLAQRSQVLDRNGKVIAVFYDQNRVNVPLSKIAPVMKKAILAIEDARFYEHGAIDLQGTLRAFLRNQATGTTQGGSTITQQLAKMTAVQQARTAAERRAATADTYTRKLSELRHAIAFEKNFSKDWILNRYLNTAYFGEGAYGVQAAARHYFSVDASQLKANQAALLAGLVRNPVGYSPSRYSERATQRRNVVLSRMASQGALPKELTTQLAQQPLGLKLQRTSNGCLASKSPFFCDYTRRYLLADPALGKTQADRAALLDTGGLTIKTTLDMRYARAADKGVRDRVYPTDNAIGGMAMVEPGTGEVRAIAQSRPMGRNAKKGETFLNYVVPRQYGDAAGFQPGSTFKVFVLAAALEQGLPTSTSFSSPQQMSIPQNTFPTCEGNYSGSTPWVVNNSTGSGTFNMTTGTQKSVNTYFAQLERRTGLCEPFKLAQEMGITLPYPDGDKNNAAQRVPSFVLGVAETSPVELAGAYATFAARGKFCKPQPVTQVLNQGGKVFKKYSPQCKQVLSKSTADNINQILKGVLDPGGFGSSLALNKPSAGKTGTINSNMAVWFSGYTPTLSTTAMVAGANQQGHWVTLNGQQVGGQYIGSAFGSTVAGPVWADAMRGVQDLLPDESFTPPSSSSGSGDYSSTSSSEG